MPRYSLRRRRRYARALRRYYRRRRVPRLLNRSSTSICFMNCPVMYAMQRTIATGQTSPGIERFDLLNNSGQEGSILKQLSFRNFCSLYEFFRIVKVSVQFSVSNIVGTNGAQIEEFGTGFQRCCYYNGPRNYATIQELFESSSCKRKVNTGQAMLRQNRVWRASGIQERCGWLSTRMNVNNQIYDLYDYADGDICDKFSPCIYYGVKIYPANGLTANTNINIVCVGNVTLAFKCPRFGAHQAQLNKAVEYDDGPDDDDDDDGDDMDSGSKNVKTSGPTSLTRQETQADLQQVNAAAAIDPD